MNKSNQQKKTKVVDDKIHITARVDMEGYNNCLTIAEAKQWSLSQVVNNLMKMAKMEDFK